MEYQFEDSVSARAVIFDMDGVIFDSEQAVYQGWLELAKKYHIPNIETVYVRCIGVNAKIARGIFLEHYGEDFPYDQYKAEQSRNYHAKYDGGHLPLKPGIKELLVALKSRGVKTAVASSTRTALVEQQIRENGLGEYFDVIVGGDMVEKSKPEPDIFLKAANLLGIPCERCYVIEDSYNGIRGAQAAGMIPIMVPDMLEPDDEMRQKARYILKDLYEVEKIIMSNIKVLLWDIDATLLNFEKAEKAAINSCFEKFGLGECTEEMLRTYIVINRKHWEALEKGTLTKQEVLEGRFREFFGVYGLDVTKAEAFNIEYQIRLGDTVVFNDNGYELVKSLKGKVLQYAVTNGTKAAQDRKLAKSGLIDLFDGIFISDVIGYEKPSIQFFDAVFDQIGEYDKSEMVIIGDSLTSDIQGGNNAEILTCWYNPNGIVNVKGLKIDYEITDLNQILDYL